MSKSRGIAINIEQPPGQKEDERYTFSCQSSRRKDSVIHGVPAPPPHLPGPVRTFQSGASARMRTHKTVGLRNGINSAAVLQPGRKRSPATV